MLSHLEWPLRWPRRAKALLLAVLLAVALAGCGEADGDGKTTSQRAVLPTVAVANPLTRKVTEWDEYTGRFEARERVELRARVSGYLTEVRFEDGAIVEEGDVLFVIDPRPFRAELARARAELGQARTQLNLARLSLGRAEQLAPSQAISQEVLDRRRAEAAQAEQTVLAREAAVHLAELNLSFTEVRAPMGGRISERRVDVGNLVSGGTADSTLLATILTLDPIDFVFDASEADYLRYARLYREGRRPSSRTTANPVYVRLMDETRWDRLGRMDFVDNEFTPASGTIRGRAVFQNADHFLTPGMFGRLRLIGSPEYTAVMIPDAAILADQRRRLVLTLGADDVVETRVVELGPVIDGLRVVRAGLDADDLVIVSGLQRARPGARVAPEAGTIAPAPEMADAGPAGQ